jgi:hypothetical protein
MVVLLLYTAVYVPYRTAFIDDSSEFMTIFELTIDILFFLDIIVNFFSAYEEDEKIEVRLRKITKKYLKTWFFLDFIAW